MKFFRYRRFRKFAVLAVRIAKLKSRRRRWKARAWQAMRTTGMLLILTGYSLAYFGFPLPRPSEKDLSKPFPCASRSCGCMSAESCWQDCCCFTLEQKLAWATENGAPVPAWVEARLAGQGKVACCCAKPSTLARRASGGCCSQKVVTSTCCQRTPGANASGSPEGSSSCCSKPAKPTKKSGWVLGMLARKCKGQGTDWLALASVLPAPPRVTWQPNIVAIEPASIFSCILERIFLDPPTPPPRLG